VYLRLKRAGGKGTPSRYSLNGENMMNILVGMLYRHARGNAHRTFRLTWACIMIATLIVTACLPATAALPHPGAASKRAEPSKPMPMTADARRMASDALARLPLGFEAQATESGGQFLARTDKWNVHLTATEAAMTWRADADVRPSGHGAQPPTATLRMQMIGANPRARLTGENQLPTQTSYFIGNDVKQWRTRVPNYARVKATNIYPGIDAIYYGDGRQLEYDFNIAARADAKVIRLRFAGVRSVRIGEAGDLIIETSGGDTRHHQPLAYQVVNGSRREVAARFVAKGRCEIGFALGVYDHSLPLVIDPIIDFTAVLGDTLVTGMAVDAAGNIYLTGAVSIVVPDAAPSSLNLADHSVAKPRSQAVNPVQVENHNGQAFIAKIDPSGSTLIYLTYVGGFLGATAFGIAVDAEGSAYITGQTLSRNFPVTPGAFQTVPDPNSLEAFIVKLNPSGAALTYATYLGGNDTDTPTAIAVDAAGNAYVTGFTLSSTFPLQDPFQERFLGGSCSNGGSVVSCSDGFVTKLNADGSGLIYSSYIGGSGSDLPTAIAVDPTGSAFITGSTTSPDLTVTPGAFQSAYHGSSLEMGFVLKVNAAGALDYATYLGGSGRDSSSGIAVDAAGSAYVTGYTSSTDFPVTAQALQADNASNNLSRSTNGGGNWQIYGRGLPSSEATTIIVIDPVTPSTLYAGTNVGMYKSTDGGANWRIIAEVHGPVTALAIDPKNPATLYASALVIPNGIGVVKSTDGGESWLRLDVQPVFVIDNIVIDPQTPSTLYVSTQGIINSNNGVGGNILKSTDGGQTWVQVTKGLPSPLPFVSSLTIAPSHPETLYVDAAGLYRSVDGGLKWKPVATPVPIVSLAISAADSNVLYGAIGYGVLKSVNGGAKWKLLSGLPPNVSVGRIWLDPTNPSTVYAGGVDLFKSLDAGATWTAIDPGLPTGQTGVLAIDPQNPATLYATNNSTFSTDAFITRLNASGSGLIFSTYLGGSDTDRATAITLDAAGNAYVLGASSSKKFPVKEALQSGLHQQLGGSDTFIAKLDPMGRSLIHSSLVGVPDGRNIALDAAGNIYIATHVFSNFVFGPVPLREIVPTIGLTHSIVVKITEPAGGIPAPLVTAVSPDSGAATGGTAVTINVQVIDSATIQATMPPRTTALQLVDVTVVNPDGQSYALVDAFNSITPPTINSVSVSGQDLVVVGTAFDDGAVLLINGVRPTTKLIRSALDVIIGKKLARQIKKGQTVTVTVQNSTGFISEPFVFTRLQ
jgi:photosystem II stability/assembly factor-like uncharacterized protein